MLPTVKKKGGLRKFVYVEEGGQILTFQARNSLHE